MRSAAKVVYEIEAAISPGTPARYLPSQVSLRTNSKESPTVAIPVQGRVVGSVEVGPDPLYLGTPTEAKMNKRSLVVRGRRPVRITAIHCDIQGLEFRFTADRKKVHLIPIIFSGDSLPETSEAEVEVEDDTGRRKIPIRILASP